MRLLVVAVLGVLMVSAAMPASAHINLLQNPGFETGEEDPWDFLHGGLDPKSHTGNWAGRVAVDEDEGWIRQGIDPQCAEYLEFWYYSNIDVRGLEFGIVYSDGTEHWEDLPLNTQSSWAFIHEDLDTTKLVVRVEVWMGLHPVGNFAVDDFDLEACTTAVGGVVIPANNFAIVAPWLGIIGLVGCIGTAVVVAKKRQS
jgi:hypothetical protein